MQSIQNNMGKYISYHDVVYSMEDYKAIFDEIRYKYDILCVQGSPHLKEILDD